MTPAKFYSWASPLEKGIQNLLLTSYSKMPLPIYTGFFNHHSNASEAKRLNAIQTRKLAVYEKQITDPSKQELVAEKIRLRTIFHFQPTLHYGLSLLRLSELQGPIARSIDAPRIAWQLLGVTLREGIMFCSTPELEDAFNKTAPYLSQIEVHTVQDAKAPQVKLNEKNSTEYLDQLLKTPFKHLIGTDENTALIYCVDADEFIEKCTHLLQALAVNDKQVKGLLLVDLYNLWKFELSKQAFSELEGALFLSLKSRIPQIVHGFDKILSTSLELTKEHETWVIKKLGLDTDGHVKESQVIPLS